MMFQAAGMRVARVAGSVAAALAAVVLAACNNGGGGGSQIVIVNINTNPVVVTAGSTVELTASISAPGQNVNELSRYWTVSAGALGEAQPDFTLTQRGTAALDDYSDDLLTTKSKIYWAAPATPGAATICLDIQGQSKTITVTVGTSPVALSVTDGGSGKKVCTVQVNSIQNLYQAAFRVNYSSAWQPVSAAPGDFLGSANDILWLGLANQAGYVPCAITRKGSAAGVDGSGVLATITFAPVSGTSAAREAESIPFEVSMVQLKDASGQAITPAP
jgi:hypothetical protein